MSGIAGSLRRPLPIIAGTPALIEIDGWPESFSILGNANMGWQWFPHGENLSGDNLDDTNLFDLGLGLRLRAGSPEISGAAYYQLSIDHDSYLNPNLDRYNGTDVQHVGGLALGSNFDTPSITGEVFVEYEARALNYEEGFSGFPLNGEQTAGRVGLQLDLDASEMTDSSFAPDVSLSLNTTFNGSRDVPWLLAGQSGTTPQDFTNYELGLHLRFANIDSWQPSIGYTLSGETSEYGGPAHRLLLEVDSELLGSVELSGRWIENLHRNFGGRQRGFGLSWRPEELRGFLFNVNHDRFEDNSLIEESDVLPFEDRGVWGFGLGYRLEFGGASSQEE